MTPTRHFTNTNAILAAACTVLATITAAIAIAPAAGAAPLSVAEFFGNPPGIGSPLAGRFGAGAPLGIAVNGSGAGPVVAGEDRAGDIYVADTGNQRIQRFSAEGEFELMWGRDVISPEAQINTDLGDVFEVCTHAPDCQAGKAGSLGGELTTPTGVVVDQATGNVYVVERNNPTGSVGGARVQAFTADGGFLWMAGKDVVDGAAAGATGDTPGGNGEVCTNPSHCKSATVGAQGGEFGPGGANTGSGSGANGIAVSPVINPLTGAGNVVVTDRGNRRVQELTSSGGFVRAFGWNVVATGGTGDDTVVPVDEFEICGVAAQCQAGTAGTGTGQFASNTPNRAAVDSTGAIYTVENSANRRVQKFTPQVGPPELSPAVFNPSIGPGLDLSGTNSSNTPVDVAIGSGDRVLVLRAFAEGTGTPPAEVNGERRVVELDSTGAPIEIHAARAGIDGAGFVAVNSDNGKIYMSVGSAPPNGGTGVYILGVSFPPSASMGVGGVGSHSAQLNGLVNPGGPGTPIGFRTRYRFEYREAGDPDWIAASADRDAGNAFSSVAVSETLDGLEADTAYEVRLIAYKPFSGVPDTVTSPETFITPPSQPDIEAVFVTDREATSATLNARINPNGEATSYRFEYGTTAAYGSSVPASLDPPGSAGAGGSSVVVSEAISGLAPQTTYHVRVVATNANGSSQSADRTFTTATAGPQPPDNRAYELVSPPDKVGGSGLSNWYAGPGSHGNAGTAAPVGDRFVSYTFYGASLANGGFAYASDATLGERTPSGWVNEPAFNRMGGINSAEFAKLPGLSAASDSLSLTAWEANSQLAIFEGQPFNAKGQALRDWETGRWEIIAELESGQRDGAGNVFTAVARGGGHTLSGSLRGVAGPGDPSNFTSEPGDYLRGGNVYINDVSAGLSDTFPGDGIRSIVNVCTGEGADRTAIPSVDGDGELAAVECPAKLDGRDARLISPRGASFWESGSDGLGYISDDGARAFFVSPALNADNDIPCTGEGAVGSQCPPQLYVRQRNPDGSVVVRWISQSTVAGQDAGLLATAIPEAATPDGDKVFFRTASPLTADDPNGAGAQVPGGVRSGTAHPNSVDLYMYDFPDAPGADPADGTLTRVSAGPTGAGDANVSENTSSSATSSLRTFSEDGTRLYFTTASPLPGVPAPSNGTTTTAGGSPGQTAIKNLYLYNTNQPSAQRWRFIAQLPAETTLGGCAAQGSRMGPAPFFTSFNGIGGAFQLGADPNCVRTNTDGTFITFFTDGQLTGDDSDDVTGDVYAYDAGSDELVRISAAQGGAGGTYECVNEGSGTGAVCHADPAVNSNGTRGKAMLQMITDPAKAGERTAFFESARRLVPGDLNDKFDVYQWRDGELSLISTGAADADDALYRGNDRTGTNVYISTRDRLTWQDHDAVLDVYSARIGGGIRQPVPSPTCHVFADNCRGAGAPPLATPTPSTMAPTGPGNARQGMRRSLSVSTLSRRARRLAARSGVLRLVVRSNRAGRVTAVARARLGKRSRRVALKVVRLDRAGKATVGLRLSRVARRRLGSGRALRVRVRVSAPGATSRAMSVRLPGVKS